MQLLNFIVRTIIFGTFFGAFAMVASQVLFKNQRDDEPEPENFFDACTEEEANCEQKKERIVIRFATEIIGDSAV